VVRLEGQGLQNLEGGRLYPYGSVDFEDLVGEVGVARQDCRCQIRYF
jgi:hypothetical protein